MNQSRIIDNILPAVIANPLYDYVANMDWSYGWKSNPTIGYAHWNNELVPTELCNGLDISEQLPQHALAAWNFIKSTHLKDHIVIRCYANAHTFGIEGYPHTDSKREQDTTVVLYMNKGWRREWGGETLVYDGYHIVSAALPAFNRAMIFKGNQFHSAKAVSRICPDLRRTLMFKCAKIGADTKRDEVQLYLNSVGATEKKHKRGSLTNHLLGTYDLLKCTGQSDTVCLAGATHSLFGTSIFKESCLTADDSDSLVKLIGEEAFNLVKIFEKTARPQTFEHALLNNTLTLDLIDGGTVTVTQEQLTQLAIIEAANLYEQTGSIPNNYTKIAELWSTVYAKR